MTTATHPATPAARKAEIRDIITIQYLRTGKTATAQELADWTRANPHARTRSVGWIRKALNENHGCPRGTTCREEWRARRSGGGYRVTVYQPTLEALRTMIANDPAKMPCIPTSYDADGNATSW